MKEESTTHKAEGLGRSGMTNVDPGASNPTAVPQPAEEQLVIEGMMQCLRGLKRSELPGVAHSAREWERVINYRIQVSLQERVRRAQARLFRLQASVEQLNPQPTTNPQPTSCPSGGRSRPGVSPARD